MWPSLEHGRSSYALMFFAIAQQREIGRSCSRRTTHAQHHPIKRVMRIEASMRCVVKKTARSFGGARPHCRECREVCLDPAPAPHRAQTNTRWTSSQMWVQPSTEEIFKRNCREWQDCNCPAQRLLNPSTMK